MELIFRNEQGLSFEWEDGGDIIITEVAGITDSTTFVRIQGYDIEWEDA